MLFISTKMLGFLRKKQPLEDNPAANYTAYDVDDLYIGFVKQIQKLEMCLQRPQVYHEMYTQNHTEFAKQLQKNELEVKAVDDEIAAIESVLDGELSAVISKYDSVKSEFLEVKSRHSMEVAEMESAEGVPMVQQQLPLIERIKALTRKLGGVVAHSKTLLPKDNFSIKECESSCSYLGRIFDLMLKQVCLKHQISSNAQAEIKAKLFDGSKFGAYLGATSTCDFLERFSNQKYIATQRTSVSFVAEKVAEALGDGVGEPVKQEICRFVDYFFESMMRTNMLRLKELSDKLSRGEHDDTSLAEYKSTLMINMIVFLRSTFLGLVTSVKTREQMLAQKGVNKFDQRRNFLQAYCNLIHALEEYADEASQYAETLELMRWLKTTADDLRQHLPAITSEEVVESIGKFYSKNKIWVFKDFPEDPIKTNSFKFGAHVLARNFGELLKRQREYRASGRDERTAAWQKSGGYNRELLALLASSPGAGLQQEAQNKLQEMSGTGEGDTSGLDDQDDDDDTQRSRADTDGQWRRGFVAARVMSRNDSRSHSPAATLTAPSPVGTGGPTPSGELASQFDGVAVLSQESKEQGIGSQHDDERRSPAFTSRA